MNVETFGQSDENNVIWKKFQSSPRDKDKLNDNVQWQWQRQWSNNKRHLDMFTIQKLTSWQPSMIYDFSDLIYIYMYHGPQITWKCNFSRNMQQKSLQITTSDMLLWWCTTFGSGTECTDLQFLLATRFRLLQAQTGSSNSYTIAVDAWNTKWIPTGASRLNSSHGTTPNGRASQNFYASWSTLSFFLALKIMGRFTLIKQHSWQFSTA